MLNEASWEALELRKPSENCMNPSSGACGFLGVPRFVNRIGTITFMIPSSNAICTYLRCHSHLVSCSTSCETINYREKAATAQWRSEAGARCTGHRLSLSLMHPTYPT